jgi:hypothetical protein
MAARKKQEAAEARLLRLAAWFLDRGEPATREQVYDAFPDDYAGGAAAKEKKFSRDKKDLLQVGIPLRFTDELGEAGSRPATSSSAGCWGTAARRRSRRRQKCRGSSPRGSGSSRGSTSAEPAPGARTLHELSRVHNHVIMSSGR